MAMLTDWGQTEYVGVAKGVILSCFQTAIIVDITHSILPQCTIQAAWILGCSYRYFPPKVYLSEKYFFHDCETVFMSVVDPGVGSSRRAVAVQTKNYFFVGPDNGTLATAVKEDGTT